MASKNLMYAGLDDQIGKVRENMDNLINEVIVKSRQMDWGSKNVERLDKRLRRVKDEMQKALLKGDEERFKILNDQAEKISKTFGNPKSKRVMAQAMGEASKTFGEGIQGAFQTLKSKDMSSIFGMFQKMGKAATAAGTKMEATAMGGLSGDAVAGLGKGLAAIGPAIMAIAGVAVGLAALAKVVMDADAKIKDLNKSMIEAGISGQEFGSDIAGGMENVRKAFAGWGAAADYLENMGISTKDAVSALGSLQKGGMTLDKIQEGSKNSAEAALKLREAIKGTVIYAKLLGESADRVAGDMAKMAEETSSTLEGVRDNFHEIAAAAKQSGFDTKRFYGMVLEVTTGMSMYNVRLQDTIGLLSKAGKVLGPDAGKAWAQSLAGQGKDLSTRDAVVSFKKMGKGQVRETSKIDARIQAESLGKSFRDIEKKGGAGKETLNKALERAGLRADMSPEDLAKGLGQMSRDQADILRADLNKVEGVVGLGTKTAHAQMVARAGEGKGGLGGGVNAIQNWGAYGGLMAKVRGAHAVEGGRLDMDRMDTEDIVGRIAAEQVGGKMTPQDMDMLRDAIGSLKSKGDKVTMEGIGKEMGLMISTAEDGAKKLEEEKKKKEDAWIKDQEIASDIRDNTRSLSEILESRIEALLYSIDDSIREIVSALGFIPGFKGMANREMKDEAANRVQKEIEDLTRMLGDVKGTDEGSREKRKEIEKEITRQREVKRQVHRSKTRGSADDIIRQATLVTMTQAEKEKLERERALAGHTYKQNQVLGPTLDPIAQGLGGAVAGGLLTAGVGAVPAGIAAYSSAKGDEEKYEKSQKEVDQFFFEKDQRAADKRTGRNREETLKGFEKIFQTLEATRIASALMSGGAKQEEALAAARAVLAGRADTIQNEDLRGRALAASGNVVRMKDGELMYSDSSGRREFAAIADDDVVDIHRRGRRSGGRGGGVININVNQWGDVPNAILKALETMRVRT